MNELPKNKNFWKIKKKTHPDTDSGSWFILKQENILLLFHS